MIMKDYIVNGGVSMIEKLQLSTLTDSPPVDFTCNAYG